MTNEPLLSAASDLWYMWHKRQIEAATTEGFELEDYDLIASVAAIYKKQLMRLIVNLVTDDIKMNDASERLAEDIAELLGTK
jgi:hypothetical protein